MHGQGRAEYKARQRDETISAGLSQKARQWHALTSELMSQRQTDNSSSSTSFKDRLRLSEKLLTVNPDPIYLWNCRRDIVLQTLQSPDASPIHFIQDEQSLTATCLKRNPKAYGAWFHRKWCIRNYILLGMKIHVTDTLSEESNRLDLFQRYKSILDAELDLCAEFLQHDERNFHCWNYRRFIVSIIATVLALMSSSTVADLWTNQSTILALLQEKLDGSWWWRSSDTFTVLGSQVSPTKDEYICNQETADTMTLDLSLQDEKNLMDKELKFTDEKIAQNFSNGSAFHYRSILLQYKLEIQSQIEFSSKDPVATNSNNMEKRNAMKLQLIQNELEIVHNAIFTEPDDQTPWWYYRFLIQWANPSTQRTTESVVETTVMEQNSLDSFQSLLLNEIHVIKDLIETENNVCKWGYLTLHFIMKIMETLENNSEDNRKEWMIEAEKCLSHLMDIDPDRIHRYESLM